MSQLINDEIRFPLQAWVISIKCFDNANPSEQVLAVISLRKGDKYIRHFLENAHSMLVMGMFSQLKVSRYNRPLKRLEAEATPKGQPSIFSLCDWPYILTGSRSVILKAWEENFVGWLEWKESSYQLYNQNCDSQDPLETFPESKIKKAPLYSSKALQSSHRDFYL